MTRRRFAFWLGLALFTLADKLRLYGFDELAAAIIQNTTAPKQAKIPSTPEHWSVESNKTWWWYERQNLADGQWTVTGLTNPINKKTGQPFVGPAGYLDQDLIPKEIRVAGWHEETDPEQTESPLLGPGQADPARKARHGRPPSKWLRSLNADELRIWLKTIDVPEAGVSGMTFWKHLTEDHSFDPEKIEGLTIPEQAQLHAAAHFGY